MNTRRPSNDSQLTIRNSREPYVALTLVSLGGPLLWVLHFAVIYLAEGFVCSRQAWSAAGVTWIIGIGTLLLVPPCLWLAMKPGFWIALAGGNRVSESTCRFLMGFTRWLAALSVLAMAWAVSSVFLVGVCRAVY